MTKEKIDIKRFVGKELDGRFQMVHFQFYRRGNFFYAAQDFYTSELYDFPVPIDDIGTATLSRTDKAITFMRWIRKAITEGTFIKH